MRIDVLTLFPEMCEGVFNASILGKAREKGLVTLNTVNFRDYSTNKHSTVDDYPYGGGGGMVLKPDPIFAAVEDVSAKAGTEGVVRSGQNVGSTESESSEGKPPRVILMCPQGERFSQTKAEELAEESHLIFICGHYEGYDERIREHLVTDELSIGDYVLTGGELPAMVVVDSVVRLLPGVLGNESSAVTDSFSTGLLEYPHYTRPAEFRGWKVPDVLISGHHANIEVWRREQALKRTLERRPDLLDSIELSEEEQKMLRRLKSEPL
ncbi:tRNA (guanosine(37)-N1)-methyltransferase TrmD [Paenibacillus apiarius]|uniref:tRNA (guanine-N(1)-)-methyltransferase n=3 Tax=Paenibacillus apiarius TaxID=46240 RepID=A0ABT4DLX7_9BACL|nr:tRNA (guanosine(37)-N1)-methyltransferase TrmD [Paenibacillus apiarius]MCY9518339.1 tRNA (guanosine(37)-N1)-methyltransferase TrmD [Paenibacillus apiarius]MCY9551260.1 tRNA (guanosine(37)-N1)-methyltransferase TrmD [Paenibacillus apiarius]MCY9558414.1 tRNA (guanosine(37)-N1)-methyltransferase TrmD [Paenibacillus apiarius]MCY9721476.1 tRNA (guanosine(37)-N1)-methyltransferase TrmD [Paenibacillus apiarius]MCY9728267.1 tRNA (guanosine(37)-N1)-methyltransferase TrmD [Paenibacillus apiarius]